MKTPIYLFLLCFVILFSCTKDDVQKACYNEDPVEELEWLSLMIEETATSSIYEFEYIKQAEHNGELIFIFGNCCPNCLSIFSVYNCSGDKIANLGNQEGEINFSILENAKVIWKPDNSQCNFN